MLNANSTIPDSYAIRDTVKVVIVNPSDQIVIFDTATLPGGGVDQYENDEAALKRECMEELGMSIKDIKQVCIVEQYRDFLQRHYLVRGYMASLDGDISEPTSTDAAELDRKILWLSPQQALDYMTKVLRDVSSDKKLKDDALQGRLYNIATAKIIVTQALEEILSL